MSFSFSPALAHRQRTMAALASQDAVAALPEITDDNPAAAEYRQLLAAMHNDLRSLHDIESTQGKIERKAGMIGAYLPWVEGALAAGREGRAVQDEIVATMLVWALDLGDWPLALDLGRHVLTHGVEVTRMKRNPACVIAEEVADRAKAEPAAVPLAVLRATRELTEGRDMPDQVTAKLLRAIGLAYGAEAACFDPAEPSAVAGGKPALVAAALDALTAAVRLNPNVGVKKQIEALEREARALAAASAPEQTSE